MIIGRKLNTLPTPVKIPSITRECITGLTSVDLKIPSTRFPNLSIPISRRLWSLAPITLKVRKNTSPIIRMKEGIAVYLPVRILSIRLLLLCDLLSLAFTTVSSHTLLINLKRISAIAADLSSPRSFPSDTLCDLSYVSHYHQD